MKRRKYLWSRFLLIIGAHGTTILTRLQNGNFNVHKCVNANAIAITTTRTIANNCKFSQGVASTEVLHKLLQILWNDFPLGASDNLDYVLQWQIGEDFMEAGRFWEGNGGATLATLATLADSEEGNVDGWKAQQVVSWSCRSCRAIRTWTDRVSQHFVENTR